MKNLSCSLSLLFDGSKRSQLLQEIYEPAREREREERRSGRLSLISLRGRMKKGTRISQTAANNKSERLCLMLAVTR